MAKPLRRPSGVLDRALEKPLVALQAAITGDALIKAVFALLQRAVKCDFAGAFLRHENHPYGSVPSHFIDSRGFDFGPQLADGVFFRDHPAMPVVLANPGIRFINTRETLPPEEILHASRFYQEVMQVMGFRHAIGMFFWDVPPRMPEVVLSVERGEGQPDFTDEDVAILDRLYPQIDAALRRIDAIENERAVRNELQGLIDPARAACVLHWDLTVAEANRAARELCARWNLSDARTGLKPPPFALPEPLRHACMGLKKRWQASLRQSPATGTADRLTVRHPECPSLSAKASLHVHNIDSLGKPVFLIEFESAKNDSAPPRRINGKAKLAAFTLGERELIRLVSEGRSNQEIATTTGRALGSVKNALHAIFDKAGVRSRTALIAKING
ncbi:MAG: helix-turn-helix transcriptional regulator [Chthoniobacteraceae bacterium]